MTEEAVTQRQVKGILLAGIILLGFLFLLYVLKPIYSALLIALVVFYLLYPIEARIEARLKRPRLALLFTAVFVLLPGFIFFFYIILKVAVEMLSLLSTPEARQALAAAGIDAQGYIAALQRELVNLTKLRVEEIPQLLTNVKGYEALLQTIFGGVLGLFKALGGAFFQLFLGALMALYLVAKAGSIRSYASGIADQRIVAYFSYLDALLRQIVYSIFLTALFTGLLSYGVYLAFGLPFTGLLSALTGVLTLIPIVGGWLVYAPMAGYLYFTYGAAKAAFFLVTCVALLSVLPDMIIRPAVASFSGRVPVVPLIIGFIAGTATLGAKGILLGPVIIFAAMGFFRIFVRGED